MPGRDERGAVALITAAMASLLILVAALAVDLGMQRVVRADAQAVADVAALDMARELATLSPGSQEWRDALAESLTRNDRNLGERPATAPGADWVCTVHICAVAEAGWVNADHVFAAGTAPTGQRTAVRVRTTAEIDFALAAGIGGASREAVAAVVQPAVCYSVGTRTLALNTSRSALSPLLDHILRVDLGAAGHTGIVAAKDVSVPLADVVVPLQVGSLSQLLSTEIALDDLIALTAAAVRAEGDAVAASALEAVTLGASDLGLRLGDILDLGSGGAAGLTGEVNVLDLLTAAIVAAGGDHAVAGHLLAPGATGVSVTVIEPPRIACGSPVDTPRPTARSAQVRLRVQAPLGATSALGVTQGGVDLSVEAGSGEATLVGMSCVPEAATFDVTTGALTLVAPVAPRTGQVMARVTLAKFLDFIPALGWVLRQALNLLGLDPVGLDIRLSGSVASASVPGVAVAYPARPSLPPTTVVTGTHSTLNLDAAQVTLATGQDGLATLLGALLNPTLEGILTGVAAPLVETVVDPLVTAVVQPVLRALGMELGVTELEMQGRPACTPVELVR